MTNVLMRVWDNLHLLAQGEGKHDGVVAHTVKLEAVLVGAQARRARLLDDPEARGVLDRDQDLDGFERRMVSRPRHEKPHRGGRHSASTLAGAHPVPEV